MTLVIIGHGYVGLVTAAVFADLGNTVYCVGRNKGKIDNLKKGILPFFEPGLEEVVKRNLCAKRLNFTLSYKDTIPKADIIFICVGTPSKFSGEADLSAVFEATKSIAENLQEYVVVACKSTVPVGTNKKIKDLILRVNKSARFDIASCPEFLREGTALSDTLNPDRIILGTDTQKAQDLLINLHKPIDGLKILTNIETAEMIKYASNALLATKISFANVIAFICDKIGADAEKVLEGVGTDSRIGRSFLYPGVGFGGSCFPKDVKALIVQAEQLGYDFTLLKSVREINDQAAAFFINKIVKLLPKKKNTVLGVLGLAFKPNTDDMRDAPSISIINTLLQKGYQIQVYDPQAMNNAKNLLTKVKFAANPYEAAKGTDALLILTEWNEFRQLNLSKVKQLMKFPVIFDGRNIYDINEVKKIGFTYFGVGRN